MLVVKRAVSGNKRGNRRCGRPAECEGCHEHGSSGDRRCRSQCPNCGDPRINENMVVVGSSDLCLSYCLPLSLVCFYAVHNFAACKLAGRN